jgi:hypothetical protein
VVAALLPSTVARAEPLRGVRVTGATFTLDGQPFVARGFNLIGVLPPDNCATTNAPRAVAAREHFGPAELAAARTRWHATTVRFQVSQSGLDPVNPLHSASYVERIKRAVAEAQAQNLVVILSMQDQFFSCGTAHPLPHAATIRAWQTLAPVYAHDPMVLYELFNEPQNSPDEAGWAQWRDGGAGPIGNQGNDPVGFTELVTRVRDMGARNVLLIDGASYAHDLRGMPLLAGGQLGYVVHPYKYHSTAGTTVSQDRSSWDQHFGYLAGQVPLLATEWNASDERCVPGAAEAAAALLAYLDDLGVGLLGHAFDVPGTMVTDLISWDPTTMDGFGCTSKTANAGQLVLDHFTAQAQS